MSRRIYALIVLLAGIALGSLAYYFFAGSSDQPGEAGSDATEEPSFAVEYADLAGVRVDLRHGTMAEVSSIAFTSSDLAILTSEESMDQARGLASQHGIPLLIAGEEGTAGELDRLGVRALYLVGAEAPEGFDGDTLTEIPEFEAGQAEPFTILTDEASPVLSNLEAAGGSVVEFDGDPRSADVMSQLDGEVVPAIAADYPDLEWQLASATSGLELPGGGQLVFDNKHYIALYGSPVTETLGVLGEQDVPATIERAAATAAEYDTLIDGESIPTLEIIATVASGAPGSDGNYSNEWPIETLLPLIEAAGEAGQYVVLDFQPGRADFLTQVKMYEELLKLPYVGIALDPEWRIGPDEMPLTRVGHVEIDEVNEVVTYLADFVRENNLPQKMIILHQFQVQMLRDIDQLDQSRSEVALLIHADGQGSQRDKAATWGVLHENAPHVERWGWKNFYDEDHPMLTPEETVLVEPLPDFISYQ